MRGLARTANRSGQRQARGAPPSLPAPDASPARRRTIRDRFVALEFAAYARAAIQHAFTDSGIGFTRAEIPHV